MWIAASACVRMRANPDTCEHAMEETSRTGAAAPSYTMGYSDEFLQLLTRRSAKTSAAHLLGHLRRGQSVLDFGCGPGTISVGLAEAVHPGELHCIDMEASQIDMARAAATAGGHDNMKSCTGDVTALPFEDDFVDVAHGHAVLMHVPDTHAALTEVRRVLRPGGLLSCRELIVASCFLDPEVDDLNSAWATFADLLSANGGHPQLGRQLKGVLQDAGFVDIEAGAEFEFFGSAEDIDFFHGFVNGWFCSPATVDAAVEHGLARRQWFDAWRQALDRWKDEAGAVAAMGWGYALARSP